MDLATADFSGLDLRFANFSGSTFVPPCQGTLGSTTTCAGADFDHADLEHADLEHAVFGDCCGTAFEPTLSEASFTGADLPQVDASGATFAELPGLDLRRADLTGATVYGGLDGSDLTHADLSGASMAVYFGGFTHSVLRGTDFSGANVGGRAFTGAALSEQTNFAGAEIQDADFTGTKIVPTDRTVQAASPSGTVVKWKAPRALPGASLGTCAPASGSQFPVGVTTVHCAVDGGPGLPGVGGPNTASASFTVTVQ